MKKTFLILAFAFVGLNSINVKAQEIDSIMIKNGDTIYLLVDEQPEFLLDESSMSFLAHNITYPYAAKKERKEGKCHVNFVVEKDGSVSNIEVTLDFGYGSKEEVERVIKMMNKWKPAKVKGQVVKCHRCFTIPFNLQ